MKTIHLKTNILKTTLLLLLTLIAVGTTEAWGQVTPTTDTNGNGTIEDNEKHLYLIQTNQFQSFYISLNGDNLNTVNLPHANMLWYFIEAENDNGTQYYYIVNNSTGKYICNSDYTSEGRTIELATFDAGSTDKFKFKLVENNPAGATGYYNINIKPNGSGWLGLNKQGGNAEATNKNIRLTNEQYINQINSRWKFIPYDGTLVWPNPPFTLSPGDSKTYYRIRNKKNTAFYISTNQSTSKVTYSNTESNDMAWYFKEASSDGLMKYYYIINPASGDKYMYYDGTATNGADQSNAVSIKDINDAGAEADRFLFVIVQAAVVGNNDTPINGFYMIVPKLLIENLWSSNSLGPRSQTNNSNMGIIAGRGDVYSYWSFVATEYPMHCVTPSITFDNATGKVTITTSPAGSTIHYTTDGETEPTSSSGTSYSAPFSITGQTTIKAIASKDGYENSEIATKTIYKIAPPTIQDNGNNTVSIVCATEGATIYYTTNGNTPTTSSTPYTGPLTEDVSGKTIKAIAVKSGMINSDVGSGSVTMQCAKPVFTRSGNSLTITCPFPTSGVKIYYTKNDGDPTPSSTQYSGAITVAENDVIKAIAIATGYNNSAVATKKIFNELTPTDGKYLLRNQDEFENFIDMASTEEYADKHYVLQADVTAGSEIPETFTGIFDGGMHTISSPSHALFNSVNGGTVKNVILSEVSISGGTNVGAIANEVTGDSRIYNCGVLSGTVSGSGDVGGIVGLLNSTSHVVNCYSYANITNGNNVGGIVGNNAYASTAADLKTMVMNCVFYGDIKGGTNVSPVYGGENIDNLHGGLNTYNYYAYEQLKTTAISTGKYNCALGVEDVFLKRFEFYRQLLNSNRRLAAKYASKEGATVNASDMMKWVLETADRSIAAPKPYPVLKAQAKYPSIINYDTRNLPDYSEANRNKGLKTGTLAVTISESNTTSGGQPKPTDATVTTTSLTLTRTDKDFDRYNFNYDKVQLPYYNEVGTHNYTGNKVVTGWKITNVTIGSGENVAVLGSYKAGSDIGSDGKLPYNFADRKSYAKDLYGTSGRVFAQGAYFDVPYGATSITIEPYWGEAVYVSDEYFDVVFSTGYAAQNVTQLGKPFGGNEVQVSINGSSQKVYNSIDNAVGALGSGGTVYDHAVVLVGNVHLSAKPPTAAKSFTIMSADLDKDNEPDCSFIFGHNDRQVISPVRFDFINMPGIAMAQKPNGAGSFRNVSIFKPKGWFETTNTCIVRLVQFEYDNGGKSAAPVILQGGLIDQFVSTKTSEPKVTQYIHLGGNTWFKDFGNGTHSDGSNFTPHIPISVTGGDFDAFYLSGTYRPDATVKADSAECYISSGRFGEVAGAAQQKIDGSIRWQIYNADIDNFYGGGVNADNPVTGNINIDIVNSHVGTFCGGPKFGDMSATKTVTTKATGCTFGTYFGAGYGGISYNRVRTKDATSYDFNTWQGDYTSSRGKYIAANKGVATDFDYEFFVWSTGLTGGRFYVKYASLSMAKTNDVSSTLTNCVINKNYYGGGNLGKVDGTATSVLNGCTVEGNVFGGGYSATKPKVPIRISGFSSIPNIDTNAGVFDMGEMSGTEDYELIQGTLTNNTSAINTTDKTIVTNVELTGLGQVTTTNLTISGNTIVKGQIFDATTGEVTETTGGVFGGGDMSAVNSNTLVDVQGTEGTDGVLNVFGGGNTADVGGNTVVKVTGGKVKQDVYGGGKGQTTVVSGNVTVNIGAKTEGVLSGSATVEGSVYGGSALGAVNAKKENSTPVYSGTAEAPKTTAVNIYGGNVTGSVYGGGLGQTSPSNIAAKNFGDVTVKMEGGTVSTAVYGGSNANGVLKKDATVTITGGTVGTVTNPIADAVFGGGFGEPTLVEGNVTVNIGTSGQSTDGATINGHVYGGGALGNTNASGPSTFNEEESTFVNLYKGTINGDVYGGGLGRQAAGPPAVTAVESFVGGDVNVLLDGAKVTGSIFGCNNLNGTPKGHVKVHVKRTVNNTKNTETARDDRNTYDVVAVYGGGNKADYVPTNATLTLNTEEEGYDAGNPAKVAAACTEVIIEGCDQTSIQYVYGGGNAAAVPATDVSIKGTYIIDQVFGGGNGAGEGNPGANVGIYKLNGVNTNYGTGKAVTKLYAGKIHVVYGGSNTLGNVRGGTSVSMPQKPVGGEEPEFCDELDVKEIYGAGQNAEQDGGVTMILGCITGLENVYGGAKDANVKGGVDLVVTSGHFNKVFGGNDTSGTIQGPITVTIEETGCDSVTINELYLGGNDAAYSVYGYYVDTSDGNKLKPRRSLSDHTENAIAAPTSPYSETQWYANPVLNVVSCTSIGNVFGGGFGTGATMYGSPTVNLNMIPGAYAKGIDRNKDGIADNDTTAVGAIGNVYGGGNAADVIGDTRINICTETAAAVRTNMGAEIPLANRVAKAVKPVYITGDVFGAGKGDADHVEYAKLTGNSTIVMTDGTVKQSVYGGGQLSQVTGNTTITISGGTIGTSGLGGEEHGNVYGGGKGNTTNVRSGLIQGNTNINISGGSVLHNVYGGGAHGSVGTFTYDGSNAITGYTSGGVANITITGGTIGSDGHNNGMVFGSSRGDIDKENTIYDKVAWVYDTRVIIGTENAETGPTIHGSLYGSGENGHTYHDAAVTMYSGTVGNPNEYYAYRGNVYGGGCGTDKYYSTSTEIHDGNGDTYNQNAGIVRGNATVIINGGSVANNVYGAGSMGKVLGNTSVTINTNGSVGVDGIHDDGNVYGAARGELGLADDFGSVTNSSVTLTKGTVKGSLYGGGKAGPVNGSVTVNLNGGTVMHDVYGGGALAQTNTAYAADGDNAAYVTNVNLAGTTINGDLYGGGLGQLAGTYVAGDPEVLAGTKSVGDEKTAVAANVHGPVTVTVTRGLATNVFGCNNINGAPQKTVTVNINGTNPDTYERALPIYNVYGGGNQAAYTYTDPSNPQNLQVNITGGIVGNVFGGGLSADVAGGINVNVSGGTVVDDVYGGGALANTNTANWNSSTNTWSDTSTGTYYAEVKHLTVGTSDVSSYWTRTGGSGTDGDPYTYTQASGTAASGITYYKKLEGFLKVAAESTTYKTNVLLTGGTIGNAYGGGLGQKNNVYGATSDIAAMVYGDVDVTVNGATFTDDIEFIGGSENVAKHGRVFGCNNLNGTPKGKVTVTVNSTKRTDGTNNHVKGEFEIQGVYGGGNLANYKPQTYDNSEDHHVEFGQKTKVIIDGCSNTSINKVYGGGNAADVPFTDVTIDGAFEIGYVFGGGNGGDKIPQGNGWTTNPGANVTGYANVLLRGGTIGQAFGGSDTKGNVGGADVKQETSADCPLRIVNLYGAGNGEEANSDGDINITVSACGEGSEIQNVFGGSYKANIKGDVTLNIISGIFTSVYGGNDRMGSIGGNITVNIEETDNCNKPIIIQNLYGGCYQTAYPGLNAKRIKRDEHGQYVKENNQYVLEDFESGKITVNVKSATRIDRIYGGSENGAVTGDTEVNINMVEGSQNGQNGVALPSYYGDMAASSLPSNITVTGTDGYVEVNGLVTEANATVDKPQSSVVGYFIYEQATGTAESNVTYYTLSGGVYTPVPSTDITIGTTDVSSYYKISPATGLALSGVTYYKQSVKGNIAAGIGTIGEVFGGGNKGNVSGNATVNIVTEPTVTMVSLSNAERTVLGAHIDGNVYGGGNLADVKDNTYVNICVKDDQALSDGDEHVTIGGNIYGGGKGDDDTFTCEKGMVGVAGENEGNHANDDLGTHVRIGNGTIGNGSTGGNVYGGGEVGRVEFHSVVTIGLTPKAGVTSTPEIKGNVFGGGQGVETHGYAALLRGNATVTVQQNAKVRNSVYGGGEISTIGRFWIKNVNNKDQSGNLLDGASPVPEDLPNGMPYKLRDGGKCTVNILDNAEIGPTALMTMPQFTGNVFGAGKGFLPKVYDYSADDDEHKPRRISVGDIKDYFDDLDDYIVFIKTQALVDETHVTIGDNAFVKGSVYGGSENGRVLNDTHVSIAGGQIGWGKNANGTNGRHSDGVWDANYTPSTDLECPSWNYTSPYAPYDKFANSDGTYDYTGDYKDIKPKDRREDSDGGLPTGSDGHTFYGNVFGGGSGKDPFAPGQWYRQAGFVGGNTYVTITGGHILTSVYGGNEHTDVGTYAADELTPVSGGKCIVNMTGGTLGVPRTLQRIAEHPVTCYLFGAGKGDQRIFFNTWTNVISTEVNISGNARIYGSTFGGGEDGHVMNNAVTNIGGTVKIDLNGDGDTDDEGETIPADSSLKIGTWGTSYVDGNVFGGGRGFSGVALTAGTVGGNVTVNINDGTMLGSVYGGGRLASVGTYFTNPKDSLSGQFKEDKNDSIFGHVTLTISGGTIGNASPVANSNYSNTKYSGNVFGGSMGRLTQLDGSINPIWPELAQVKTTSITISGSTTITRNVYGGGEYGTVRENDTLSITNAHIGGSVYGGGYGSDNHTDTTTINVHWGGRSAKYTYTPMQWSGCVGGNTIVSISGSATVGQNVYGGGELASVGIINYQVDYDTPVINGKPNYLQLTKHDTYDSNKNTFYDFGLSWPYKFKYIPCNPSGLIGGKTTVSITGTTTVGGYVYGAGKGKVAFNAIDSIAEQRYTEAFCANVRETEVSIGTSGGNVDALTPTIGLSVYGGGEDGHVYENTSVTIHHGTITHSAFGGGKGDSKFITTLWNTSSPGALKSTNDTVYSWTAGRVYGNTSVTMNGGKVGWFIYGGGNMGSVGKGNYAGGSDDYSTAGYGELPSANGALWTDTCFTNSGHSTVTIMGGKIGPETGTGADADGIPHGSVFGGSRGKAAMDVGKLSPRYRYVPDFFLGYVNKTAINIGGYIVDNDTTISANTPLIKGSVYGGGQDGHVRNSTEVRLFAGSITGQGEDSGRSGNIFGAGSGIGKYQDGANYYCNNSSGSVTCTTFIDIMGGSVTGSVYGGGALASVGPPQTGQGFNEFNNTTDEYPRANNKAHGSQSYNKVTIQGGSIGGSVYGASRGPAASFLETAFSGVDTAKETTPDKYNPTKFATSIWTEVNILPNATPTNSPTIGGNVYGGGEMGQVKESTVVKLTGGAIGHDAFGGGKGTRGTNAIAADVGGNTTVELNKNVASSAKGCSLERIFGCNDLNGTPKGHVLVHVYATQHKDKSTINDKYAPYEDMSKKSITEYNEYLTGANWTGGLANTYGVTVPEAYKTTFNSGTEDEKKVALESLRGDISNKKYDVIAVYGGGNLAKYDPTNAHSDNSTLVAAARTEVIIDGCDMTSIRQVYGGGNAASVPATDLKVYGTYEIDEVFGGGNGKDNYYLTEGSPATNVWYENPGANVGYENFTHYLAATGDPGGTNYGAGTEGNPYRAITNSNATNKEYRQAYYMYGEGEARTDIIGGRIHYVYGGSNQKGNISTLALSVYENSADCPVVTDETYGAGKNAEVDARTSVSMRCVEYTGRHFGGSTNADVNSDVILNISNGHFGQVYGGNNTSGNIKGSITVNIQENSCKPIVIGELYGGGYLADYSIYGYYDTGIKDAEDKPIYKARDKAKFETDRAAALSGVDQSDENAVKEALLAHDLYGYPKHNPRINVISATKIDTIFGGGYKALVVGSPYINVNMQHGIIPHVWTTDSLPTGMNYSIGKHTKTASGLEPAFDYEITDTLANGDARLAIGSIGHIYGGGNLADVNGNTNVEIGTGRWIAAWDAKENPIWETQTASGDEYTYKEKTPAVTYTQAQCDSINATLIGAMPNDGTTGLTAEQANAYNAKLTGAIANGTKLTGATLTAVNGLTGVSKTYSENEAISAADAALYNATLAGAKTAGETLTAAQANTYNAALTGAFNTNDILEPAVWAWYDKNQNEASDPSSNARNAATITGNVFGGGKGEILGAVTGSFRCATAMIGADGDGLIDANGGTTITIGNGSVEGSVYGGGEIGRVEKNTVVTIGLEGNYTNEVTIGEDVFGAGQGVVTHGYSALVRGNSTVTVQGKAKVGGNVYGGGKLASVGRYNVNATTGLPESLKNEKSGNCTVVVRDSAEIGPNDMTMTAVGGPINTGHVFGAGQGATPYKDTARRMTPNDAWENYGTDTLSYLGYLETLALATQTEVTISGNAFVKGDVFGGAENGFVQHDTHVTIEGDCQIGNGYVQMNDDGTYLAAGNQYSLNRRYTTTEWANGRLYKDGETNYQHSLPECASWTYGQAAAAADKYATHDPFYGTSGYDSKGGRTTADNGHTFYGIVFGGGSGYFPYAAGKWHWKAGNVGGNTVVNITGGHILTNVYGGNEMTSVEGKCTVNMSGGTIGVPRTLGQIIKHPVTCYLFGAGMGDTRVFFNKQTNVQDVEVNITGGWVYGSVFGGGEDGHVLRDVTMNISSPAFEGTPTYADYYAGRATKIGTWGTSYVDGNIFGGGRGFGGDAYTAGNVAGSVTMTINSGEILGSVYGGGRLGSVGYGLYDEGATGYGVMQDDNKLDDGTDGTSFFTKGRGHIDITINGGTIGNNYEYKYFTFNVDKTNKSLATIQSEKATAIAGFNTDTIPNTAFELDSVQISNTKTWKYTYRLSHTKGGNVFAGGMGRMTQLNGTPISIVDWWKLGNVKTTKLTINGGTIKSNVYGGGELGMVVGTHTSADSKDVSTEINISDGIIGTEIKDGSKVTQYTFGSVFGGGYGSLTEKLDHTGSTNPTYADTKYTYPKYIAGRVKGSTEVTMTGGAVKASVYGGGDMAAVGESKVLNTDESLTILGETLTGENGKARDGNTYVTISGGTIGIDSIHVSPTDSIYFGGATMGNVYGGGNGYINTVRSGQIYGSANVTISQAEGKTTRIYHNIYGGGAYGTVGDFTYVISEEGGNRKVTNMGALHTDRTKTGTATVTITGGTIGVDGHENGMIFGSSRGEVDEPGKRPDWLAWTDSTHVTIGTVGQGYLAPQPQIKGSIYGSGENGHTYRNTSVNIHSGTIGNPTEYYAYRGNVYGGGCGTDTYTKNGEERYNPTAGIVRGNTSVTIDGGLITGSVYGAGAMASVGTVNNDTTLVENKHTDETSSFALSWPYKFEFADSTGTTTVNISGGHIGINGTYGGDVYGSARGKAGDRYVMAHHAYVRNTVVNVSYPETASMDGLDDTSAGCITGSVHGSGEDGYVYGDSHVTLNKGLIGHSMYGAGKGQGTYTQRLLKIGADKGSTNPADSITTEIEGLISGKVMGNTYVTMNDGHVVRNIYGGGNLGSVGKGNYAGGADDYSTSGYGEKASGNLWDNVSEDSKAFLGSGKATVKVLGGTVGYVDETDPNNSFKNNLPYGNVFGSSTGVAAPNVPNDLTPRYLYCPTFFSGYVNDTEVTIGKTRADFTSDEAYETYLENDAPRIMASVYGGGQDGHVRRDTKVIINSGEIGMPFTDTNRAIFNTIGKIINEELDDPQWLHRGNVFGAGSGISKYEFHFNDDDDYTDTVSISGRDYIENDYSTSAGSVTRFTDVEINGGTIHRNVYGGGSLASVGAPKIPVNGVMPSDPYRKGDTLHGEGLQSMCSVIIGGGGQLVNIGTPKEYQIHYGGEVYGASRGQSDADYTKFGSVIWTLVKVMDGAHIQGNVYGGGDAGMVKKDTEVRIGDKVVVSSGSEPEAEPEAEPGAEPETPEQNP